MIKFSCSVNSRDVQPAAQTESLLTDQLCRSSALNSSSLKDFEQLGTFLHDLAASVSPLYLETAVLEAEPNTSSLMGLLPLRDFTWPCWSLHSSWIPLSSEPPRHAWTNARTGMLFYGLGCLPALLHALPWPTRAALGNNSCSYVIAVNGQTAACDWPGPNLLLFLTRSMATILNLQL